MNDRLPELPLDPLEREHHPLCTGVDGECLCDEIALGDEEFYAVDCRSDR